MDHGSICFTQVEGIEQCTPEGWYPTPDCDHGVCYCVYADSGAPIYGTEVPGAFPDCKEQFDDRSICRKLVPEEVGFETLYFQPFGIGHEKFLIRIMIFFPRNLTLKRYNTFRIKTLELIFNYYFNFSWLVCFCFYYLVSILRVP